MNRVDTKFLVHAELLPKILTSLINDFLILEANGERCFEYENIYYDTDDYQFYQKHHQGKLNRHKVRIRRYINAGTQFLEVKHKNNKRRTDKKRISIKDNYDKSLQTYQTFLRKTGISSSAQLVPSQHCTFKRISLLCKKNKDRLTIDFDMRMKLLSEQESNINSLGDIAIIELKQHKINRHSPIFSFMREHGIRPASFSKYCMGFSHTEQPHYQVKFNRFKKIFRRVDTILNARG